MNRTIPYLRPLLTLLLLGSLITTCALAFTDDDAITPEYREAVNACVEAGLVSGRTDGSFDPKGEVTRAEMAKMVALLETGGDFTEAALPETPGYPDISGHWAEPYIEYLKPTHLDYIRGMQGAFLPDEPIATVQAEAMLLTTLGVDISPYYTGFRWDYYIHFDAAMNQINAGIVEDTGPEIIGPFSREVAALMLYNTMNALS